MRFRDGTTFARWERWLAALTPDAPPRTLDAKWTDAVAKTLLGNPMDDTLAKVAGDLCIDGEASTDADAHLLARLVELDAQYMGWWTQLTSADQRLTDLEHLHGRRRMFDTTCAARPTLPASTLCRAMAIEALSPGRVLLLDDADGLGIVLDVPHTTVIVPGELSRQWLRAEAALAGSTPVITDAVEDAEPYDVTVAQAGSLAETRGALATAINSTREDGNIVLSLRYPEEGFLYPLLEGSGLEVETYMREVNHHLLPGPHVVDGAADLVVLRRTKAASLPADTSGDTENVRAQPYALIELESLARDRLDQGAVDRFAHAVETFAPRPKEMRDSVRDASRDILWWYDIAGFGFSAELRHDEAHLALAFAPFDPALEYAVVCSAFWTLGDRMTRTYPARTRRTAVGEVMA